MSIDYSQFKFSKPKKQKKKGISDKNRYSIITQNLDICFLCGAKAVSKHEIFFGTADRQLSKDYGLVVGLCYIDHKDHVKGVHHNIEKNRYLQQIGQKAFIKKYSHLNFEEIFKKNYL